MWKILDTICDDIINIRIENKKILKWDFKMGSSYELCAIFPYQMNGRLEEYEIRGMRPILYHKKLKLSHIIPENCNVEGYCLFPAKFYDGILYIARHRQGNIRYITKETEPIIVNHLTEQLRKTWFGKVEVKYSMVGKWIFLKSRLDGVIYYKIAGCEKLYSLHIVEEESTIILQNPEYITFYRDRDCTKEIGEKELKYESSIVRPKYRGIFKNGSILR